MAELRTYFKDFLKNIRLTKNQVKDLSKGHKTLRKRLEEDENLSKIIETTYLQGSYKRNTAVKPKNGSRSDVDIIVVTNLDSESILPQDALDLFIPFLEKYYKDKYEMNSRSIGIELSYVDLDIVVTSKIENEEILNYMKTETRKNQELFSYFEQENVNDYTLDTYFEKAFSLDMDTQTDAPEAILIPDRDSNTWEKTNPLAQIKWTIEKNKLCNYHYVNIVKAIKWWKKQHTTPRYPKGYPLEHFVGYVCPDSVTSVAEGVVKVFEEFVENHTSKPYLPDHGVPEHDVFKRITADEYEQFYSLVEETAKIARKALDEEDIVVSARYWRELFGSEFPESPSPIKKDIESFTKRDSVTKSLGSGRFG